MPPNQLTQGSRNLIAYYGVYTFLMQAHHALWCGCMSPKLALITQFAYGHDILMQTNLVN
jgi:hypothetical protein